MERNRNKCVCVCVWVRVCVCVCMRACLCVCVCVIELKEWGWVHVEIALILKSTLKVSSSKHISRKQFTRPHISAKNSQRCDCGNDREGYSNNNNLLAIWSPSVRIQNSFKVPQPICSVGVSPHRWLIVVLNPNVLLVHIFDEDQRENVGEKLNRTI